MIRAGLCHSYKREILCGVHEDTDVYMLALYSGSADISPQSEAYTPSGEVRGQGYEPGGVALTGFSVSGGDVACLDFDDVTIKRATISADGGMIYNKTKGGRAVAVVKFGGTITSTNGPFYIEMPSVGPTTSVVRIA